MGHKPAKKPEYWRHTGGGTSLCGSSRHPCDDHFYRGRGKKKRWIWVTCSIDAHFSMPRKVKSITDLRRKKGVLKIDEYYEDVDQPIKTYKGLNK